MTIEIRPIREEEWAEYCRLRGDSYHSDPADLVRFRHLVDLTETRCLFVDGEMKATGRLYNFQQSLHGRWVPMGGVASLTVPLEERRKGYISRVLRAMLEEMRDRQVPVSCLNPYVYPLYRHFGWEHAFEQRSHTLSLAEPFLAERLAERGTVECVRKAEAVDVPLLNALYEKNALRHNGYQQRSEAFWRERVLRHPYTEQPRKAYLWLDLQEQPQAYLVVEPAEDGRQTIKELITLEADGLYALLQMLQRDNLLETVEWATEPSFPLPAVLNNPRATSRVEATFMARIVDVSVAWRIRSPQAANGTVRLGVVDEVCEWNDGTWEVSAGRVSRTDSEPQAIADIGTWSQIFYGYLTIDQAIFLGKLTVKDENSLSILRTLWSTASQPMMLDSF